VHWVEFIGLILWILVVGIVIDGVDFDLVCLSLLILLILAFCKFQIGVPRCEGVWGFDDWHAVVVRVVVFRFVHLGRVDGEDLDAVGAEALVSLVFGNDFCDGLVFGGMGHGVYFLAGFTAALSRFLPLRFVLAYMSEYNFDIRSLVFRSLAVLRS
jgi:hypothetical protein